MKCVDTRMTDDDRKQTFVKSFDKFIFDFQLKLKKHIVLFE